MLRRFSRWVGAVLVAALGAGCGGGRGGEDGEPSRLLALSFDLENRTDVRRNQPLVFSFSARLDPESVTLDTLQVFRGTPTQPTPVLGRYEVRGNRVLFHPAILPGDPNPLGLPINAFGFDDATAYTVALPGVDQIPPPLRTLRTPAGSCDHAEDTSWLGYAVRKFSEDLMYAMPRSLAAAATPLHTGSNEQ